MIIELRTKLRGSGPVGQPMTVVGTVETSFWWLEIGAPGSQTSFTYFRYGDWCVSHRADRTFDMPPMVVQISGI